MRFVLQLIWVHKKHCFYFKIEGRNISRQYFLFVSLFLYITSALENINSQPFQKVKI